MAPTNRLLALEMPAEGVEAPEHLDPAYDGYALSPADLMYQRGEAPSRRQEPQEGRLPTNQERAKANARPMPATRLNGLMAKEQGPTLADILRELGGDATRPGVGSDYVAGGAKGRLALSEDNLNRLERDLSTFKQQIPEIERADKWPAYLREQLPQLQQPYPMEGPQSSEVDDRRPGVRPEREALWKFLKKDLGRLVEPSRFLSPFGMPVVPDDPRLPLGRPKD